MRENNNIANLLNNKIDYITFMAFHRVGIDDRVMRLVLMPSCVLK